ncbi:MFS transporter [Arthrobacter sp. Br18]|uniref:MFS transporter n=1 Tax=Arthrobacter sp. Br18 TaxID=1312954 RepID=UPI0004ACFD62|nr:MFS transporter [Arthrobacter sp. Br18]
MTSAQPPGPGGTLLQAVTVTTLGVLPAFLVGALAVQIRADLGIGPAEMGMAAATLFAVSGIFARRLGRLVQRIGAAKGVAASAILAATSLTGAGLAPSFGVLIVALVVGGLANGLAQPAANLGISRAVSPGRLGLAFGIKQCSIPAAGLIGGLAVPGIALVLGWRYAFAFGAVLAVSLALWAGFRTQGTSRPTTGPAAPADRGTPRRGLVLLAIGAGLAAAAATSMGVFLVDSAVESGMSPAAAGYLFAGAALLGLLIRIALGAAMDRFPQRSPYILVANLLTIGVAGYVLLGLGSPSAFLAGALLAYGAGWTWPGLVHFAVVRDNRQGAASATGVLQTGLSLGAAAGPLLFGLLVAATSYRTAWLAAAVVALLAAVTFRLGRRTIRASRATSQAAADAASDTTQGAGPENAPRADIPRDSIQSEAGQREATRRDATTPHTTSPQTTSPHAAPPPVSTSPGGIPTKGNPS